MSEEEMAFFYEQVRMEVLGRINWRMEEKRAEQKLEEMEVAKYIDRLMSQPTGLRRRTKLST